MFDLRILDLLHHLRGRAGLTSVVENGGPDGAVFKERVSGLDVLEITVLEERVLKLHGLHLNVDKPE